MKKTLLLCWLVISAALVLFSGVELIIGITLWAKEPGVNFWGPNSITQTILCVIGFISLILAIIFIKKAKNKQKLQK